MKRLFLFIFLFVFCTVVGAQEVRVVETGSFHGEEVLVGDGEVWLGVYKSEKSFMLMPSILSVESVYDAIIDADGESSGKSITVPGMGEPVFLVTGKGFEQARPVKTIEQILGEIKPEVILGFVLSDTSYRLSVETKNTVHPGFIPKDSKLLLSRGKTVQVLFEVKECSFCKWQVDWAGDLDSDGKPDFYLYLTDHYNVAKKKLFLSSPARNGKLVKEVAEFTTTGC